MVKIKKKAGRSFKDWWAENKDKQNRARREAYHSNPELREEAKEKARKNYRLRRKKIAPVDRLTIRDDKGNRYWTIGRLARMINRPIPTIRSYHEAGVLPEPEARDSRGWRLYTSKQTMLLRQAFRALDDPSDKSMQALSDVTKFVTPQWRD